MLMKSYKGRIGGCDRAAGSYAISLEFFYVFYLSGGWGVWQIGRLADWETGRLAVATTHCFKTLCARSQLRLLECKAWNQSASRVGNRSVFADPLDDSKRARSDYRGHCRTERSDGSWVSEEVRK